MSKEKYVVIISGPSGGGKTTVAEALIEKLGYLEMSRSATTRQRRNDGKDDEYVYVSVDEFKKSIEDGDVLEYTEYGGNFYGTRISELERIMALGKLPILVLDYVGVKSLRELLDYPVYAFYIYTSLDEAKRRLELRDIVNGATEAQLRTFERRVAENFNDYSKLPSLIERYDAFVENDKLDACILEICAHIDSLRSGISPMSEIQKANIAQAMREQTLPAV